MQSPKTSYLLDVYNGVCDDDDGKENGEHYKGCQVCGARDDGIFKQRESHVLLINNEHLVVSIFKINYWILNLKESKVNDKGQ